MTFSLRTFVEHGGAFWNDAAPLISTLVRQVNMGGYQRLAAPLLSQTDRSRHFLLNDASFDVAKVYIFSSSSPQLKPDIESIFRESSKKWRRRFGDTPMTSPKLTNDERGEIVSLSSRLVDMLRATSMSPTHANYLQAGVGRLEMVEIDLLGDNFIIEVKAGDRLFRSTDFRQLLAACIAIGPAAASMQLFLMNPREGVAWTESASALAEMVGITSYGEFLDSAQFFLSDSGLSV